MSHGSETRVRNRHLTIRLSTDERAAIDQAAERAGLMPGSYARQTLLGAPAPRQVRRPPVERQELSRLLGELGRIGSNLNQIARAANTGAFVGASSGVGGDAAADIGAALHRLLEMREAVLKALGRAS